MIIRRYNKYDVPDMIKKLKVLLSEYHYGDIAYDPQVVEDLLIGNLNNSMFFCNIIEEDGEMVGVMSGEVARFKFSKQVYATDNITYIFKEHRSLTAITALVKSYVAWAKERKVKQIRWGQSTGYKMDKFAILAKRLGFEQIGAQFSMELTK